MNLNNRTKIISGLALSALLATGCTQGEESFSTEPGKGYGWKDMSETHKEIHNGMNSKISVKPVSTTPIDGMAFDFSKGMALNALSDVTRVPEHYIKVWFAPYQDGLGNLHEECSIHTVMKTGQWVVPSVSHNAA